MRKIGINLQPMNEITTEDYIKLISELGFEVAFSRMRSAKTQARIANLLSKYNLEYETIHAPFGHINDIWLDNEDGKAMYEELITCVKRCVLANVPIMVVHLSSGNTPPPITDIGRMRFKKIVEYARKKHVRIAFENQRKLANLAWALETFSEDDGVGFCWDCGHESCFTPGREYMPLFGDRLMCTHIHDNEGKYNQDQHLIPFDGVINYDHFAEHIRKSGYTGPLTLELVAKNSNYYNGLSPEKYLERAAMAAKRLRSIVDR